MPKYVKKPAVQERYGGISNSHLYGLIRSGKFPAPVKLGASSVWPVEELDRHDEALIAGVDSARCPQANRKRAAA